MFYIEEKRYGFKMNEKIKQSKKQIKLKIYKKNVMNEQRNEVNISSLAGCILKLIPCIQCYIHKGDEVV